MCGVFGPYLASSSRKKKKFVSDALKRFGCLRAISMRFKRSRRESLPRQNAISSFSFHVSFARWTEKMSMVTRDMASNVASVISYVGITISNESSLPHHEKIGYGPCVRERPPFFTSGQSPKFSINSTSGSLTNFTSALKFIKIKLCHAQISIPNSEFTFKQSIHKHFESNMLAVTLPENLIIFDDIIANGHARRPIKRFQHSWTELCEIDTWKWF